MLAEARRLLDEDGRDAITMRRLAERLGIQAPSLYKHVSGKDELEDALIAQGLEELGAAVVQAAVAGGSLRSMARAYRAFARERPNLYRLLTERPLPREHHPGPHEAEAIRLLAEATGERDRARAAWAFVHGMTQLELAGRFPEEADVDAAWDAGLAAFASRESADASPAPPAAPESRQESGGAATIDHRPAPSAAPGGERDLPAERRSPPGAIVRSWHGPD
jgi:AcrR family transcriptional regulator